jgi:SulP family sulfate permease
MKLKDTDSIKSSVQDHLPQKESAGNDFVAGLTFALVNIPQGMANAILALVNPVSGLYTLMIGTPIAAIFTSTRIMNVSTTSAISVAVGSALATIPEEFRTESLIVLVVLVGLIQFLAGLLRLGTLIRFVSNAVMVGFTTGVSLLIILGQLDDFTGYDSQYSGRISSALDTLLNFKEWLPASVLVGGVVLGLILILSRTRFAKIAYVVALVAGTLVGVLINTVYPGAVENIPPIPDQLFTLVRPNFNYISVVLPSALGIAIIGLIQGAGVAQNFPNADGHAGNVSRDFLAQGLANTGSGLLSGIPGGGSMSGTAVIVGTGGRTRWANIFGGLLVIPLVLLFSDLFNLVPLPALGGLLIAVGLQSFRPDAIKTVWDTGLPSRVGMGMTLVASLLLPLQYAVFVGVAISVMLHVFQSSSKVRLVELKPVAGGFPIERPAPAQLANESVTILMPYGDLFFAAASNMETLLPDASQAQRAAVILILRGREEVGSTFIVVLRRYVEALQAHDGRLYLVGVSAPLLGQLKRTGLVDLIGRERVVADQPQIGRSANQALVDAYAWLGRPVEYVSDESPEESSQ